LNKELYGVGKNNLAVKKAERNCECNFVSFCTRPTEKSFEIKTAKTRFNLNFLLDFFKRILEKIRLERRKPFRVRKNLNATLNLFKKLKVRLRKRNPFLNRLCKFSTNEKIYEKDLKIEKYDIVNEFCCIKGGDFATKNEKDLTDSYK